MAAIETLLSPVSRVHSPPPTAHPTDAHITLPSVSSLSVAVSSESSSVQEASFPSRAYSSSSSALSTSHALVRAPASSSASQLSVAPFLSKHIPTQYGSSVARTLPLSNTKYCYRHRPDAQCRRRQTDESTMQEVQDELATLPPSDQQAISHVWSLFSAAPAIHRSLMLKGVMSQCCYPQLSLIASSVKELIKIDFISALPVELAFKILCYLDTLSLSRASQVCRQWRHLADDDNVWQHMCEQHIDRKCTKCGWGLPLLEQKRLRSARRQMHLHSQRLSLIPSTAKVAAEENERMRQLITACLEGRKKRILVLGDEQEGSSSVSKRLCRSSRSSSTETSTVGVKTEPNAIEEEPILRKSWKDVYRDRFKIGSNWKKGRYNLKTLRGHTNGVLCVQSGSKMIASGSYDTTIKLWDIETGKEIRTLTGHSAGVRCLQFDDSVLISGGMDGSVRVWNWRTGKTVRTLDGHRDSVIGLHFIQQYIATGSADMTIRVWDTNQQCTYVLRGHTEWVNSVRVDARSRTLLSSSDDMTIRLWDIHRRTCLQVLEGHVGHVQSVLPLPSGFTDDREAIATIIASGRDGSGDNQESASALSTANGDGAAAGAGTPLHHPDHHHGDRIVEDDGRIREDVSVQTQRTGTVNPGSPGSPRSSIGGDSREWVWDEDSDREEERPQPPRYVLSASLDSTIYLWDTYTGVALKKYFGHLEGVWGLGVDTLRMVSCSQDGSVKVWDLHSGRCQRTYSLHNSPVTSLSLTDDRLVSGGQDGVVQVMEFSGVD